MFTEYSFRHSFLLIFSIICFFQLIISLYELMHFFSHFFSTLTWYRHSIYNLLPSVLLNCFTVATMLFISYSLIFSLSLSQSHSITHSLPLFQSLSLFQSFSFHHSLNLTHSHSFIPSHTFPHSPPVRVECARAAGGVPRHVRTRRTHTAHRTHVGVVL